MENVKQRLSSEKTISHNLFRLKFGTMNRSNPQVVYLEGRTFISPLYDNDNYQFLIQSIRKKFSSAINYELLKNCDFDKRFILDFQIANSGVRVGKKSFLSFQLMLKQNEKNIKSFKEIKKLSEKMLVGMVDSLVEYITADFLISKTKKEDIYCKVISNNGTNF